MFVGANLTMDEVNGGHSSFDSDYGPFNTPGALLGQLGKYPEGPFIELEALFDFHYAECNQHKKSWNMNHQLLFYGAKPGFKVDYGKLVSTPIKLFLDLWNNRYNRN